MRQAIKKIFQYKEVAQCVTSFDMKNLNFLAKTTAGVTVSYNGPPLRQMHPVVRIIRIEKLKEVFLKFFLDTASQDSMEDDIYTLQSIADRSPNVRKLTISYYAHNYCVSAELRTDRKCSRVGARRELTKHISKLKNLNYLSIETDNFCGPKDFNRSLCSIMIRCENLEELYLRPYHVSFDTLQFERVNEKWLKLKLLQVERCFTLSDGGLAAITRACPNLCDLRLIGLFPLYSSSLSPVGLREIKNCLSLNRLSLKLTNYKHLDLINDAIETILTHCQKLEYLCVCKAYDLTKYSYKYRERTRLENNIENKMDSSVEVSKELYSSVPSIKSLNIGHGTEVFWISNILNSFKKLKSLTLCSCNTHIREKTIPQINEVLRKERYIITLNVENCAKDPML